MLPNFDEVVNVSLVNRHGVSLRLAQKRVDDDGDEQVQENLAHYHIETQEEYRADNRVAACLHNVVIVHPLVVVEVGVALEND